MQETWVPSLGWEDPLEKGTATHSSNLAWGIPWTIHGLQRVGHDWATLTFTWYFLKMLNIEFPNYQAAPSLGIYLRELKTCIHKNMLTDVHDNMTIIHNCPQNGNKYPSADEWKNTMWYDHAMEYYLAIKRNEILIHVTIWINLENIMLSEKGRYKVPRICFIRLYEVSRMGKSIETQSKLVAGMKKGLKT